MQVFHTILAELPELTEKNSIDRHSYILSKTFVAGSLESAN